MAVDGHDISMNENKEIYENYELDAVPSREKVYSWEQAEKYDVILWIKSSDRRRAILEMLLQEPMTTSEIADELGLKRDSAYYHLQCLRKGEMVNSDKEDAGSYPSLIESKTPYNGNFNLWGLTVEGFRTAQWLGRD